MPHHVFFFFLFAFLFQVKLSGLLASLHLIRCWFTAWPKAESPCRIFIVYLLSRSF